LLVNGLDVGHFQNYSFFIHTIYTLTDQLHVTVGARYSNDQKGDKSTTPRVDVCDLPSRCVVELVAFLIVRIAGPHGDVQLVRERVDSVDEERVVLKVADVQSVDQQRVRLRIGEIASRVAGTRRLTLCALRESPS